MDGEEKQREKRNMPYVREKKKANIGKKSRRKDIYIYIYIYIYIERERERENKNVIDQTLVSTEWSERKKEERRER